MNPASAVRTGKKPDESLTYLQLDAAASTEAVVSYPPLSELVARYAPFWKNGQFPNIPFNAQECRIVFDANYARWKHFQPKEGFYGVITKSIVPPKTRIFVRADLHGDLKSLLENLKEMQRAGLLDENFKCLPDVQIVFMGDYVDRGTYGMQILQILATLRLENPDQVHLIRGNHEYCVINLMYGKSDSSLMSFINERALEQFYSTMTLTHYIAQKGARRLDYVHFTHGTFEPQFDPAPFLDGEENFISVPHRPKLSERIQAMSGPDIVRINEIAGLDDMVLRPENSEITAYNWGDVRESTWLYDLFSRHYHLSVEDVALYMRLSSTMHKVSMLFRGHQHLLQHSTHEGKVIISTLPVGMDSCKMYQERFSGQVDRAYILETAPEVRSWTKRAITRPPGSDVSTISEPIQIHDSAV
ncbi:MAG: serine/threonine protein phosphatase [Chlamydiales bacterium]|nr:serine/threonine protein phosphatase [Chlamydiales bacterium]